MDRVVIAVQLDAEAGDRLAGFLIPSRRAGSTGLRCDHDHRCDVRIRTRADQCPEMQLQVGTELQPPDERDAISPGCCSPQLRCSIGQVFHRQDDHMVATPTRPFSRRLAVKARFDSPCHHRLVLMFCTLRGSPLAIGATTLPMSTPYLITVSPGLYP